jgi:FkbM family methyltransferase
MYREQQGFLIPDGDQTGAPAIFGHEADITDVLKHVRGGSVCVQAGGCFGLWPKVLAGYFSQVHTFEPEAENFSCLDANVRNENVWKYRAALGDEPGRVGMHLRPDNVGAHYIEGTGDIPVMTIDALNLLVCDLIWLDVEGYERKALMGAAKTLRRCHPVVAFEDKGMERNVGEPIGGAREFLQSLGYEQVDRISRDTVMAWSGRITH